MQHEIYIFLTSRRQTNTPLVPGGGQSLPCVGPDCRLHCLCPSGAQRDEGQETFQLTVAAGGLQPGPGGSLSLHGHRGAAYLFFYLEKMSTR